jgi:hypothetical protein
MQKNNALTVLGCSGSIAFMLMTGNAAQANPASAMQEYVFTASNAPEIVAELSAAPCECGNAISDAAFDQAGDRAIALYGCDCSAHRLMSSNAGSDFLNLKN